jgi:hypothetical protein
MGTPPLWGGMSLSVNLPPVKGSARDGQAVGRTTGQIKHFSQLLSIGESGGLLAYDCSFQTLYVFFEEAFQLLIQLGGMFLVVFHVILVAGLLHLKNKLFHGCNLGQDLRLLFL